MIQELDLTSRPLAAKGYESYRYKGVFGWHMIGANSDAEALSEARRGVSDPRVAPSIENLQRWNGSTYVACQDLDSQVVIERSEQEPNEAAAFVSTPDDQYERARG